MLPSQQKKINVWFENCFNVCLVWLLQNIVNFGFGYFKILFILEILVILEVLFFWDFYVISGDINKLS